MPSGDQARAFSSVLRSRVTPEPSAFISYTDPPSRVLPKRILEPSGDHTGHSSSAALFVRFT